MAENFTSLPILDFLDSTFPDTKPRFLSALRHALIKVGFFYLKNHPIPVELQEDLVQKTAVFFKLPAEKKQEVNMANSKHFRGYTGLGNEKTATKSDQRETFSAGFESPGNLNEDVLFHNLLGPNQWLAESDMPGFQNAVETYMTKAQHLADDFTTLVAEALDLEPTVFANVFQKPPSSGLKIAAYPPPPDDSKSPETEFQGVGPHKDASFLTYLLQGTGHPGLEVQNKSGMWIPAPPVPGTLVVNIGRLLETLTQGVCVATTHRVNLTRKQYLTSDNVPLGTRLTFPFFQRLSLNVTREDMMLEIPPHIASLSEKDVGSDAETFFKGLFNCSFGEASFTNAITSHPEVGTRWYPDLLADALRKQHEAKQLDDARKNGGTHLR